MNDSEKTPESEPANDRAIVIYAAAAFGAFCLGLTDLLKNDDRAIVLELGQRIREMFVPGFENVGLLSLFILIGLGTGMCWLFQPPTRLDAFARGFSVFAILAVATPGTDPPQLDAMDDLTLNPAITEAEEASAGGITPARGGPVQAFVFRTVSLEPNDPLIEELRRKWNQRPEGYGLAGFRIEIAPTKGSAAEAPEMLIRLRDPETAKIIGVEKSGDGRFLVLQPKGRYLVEVEASGYRRTSFVLELGDELVGYSLTLDEA
ncbi:MAG: hypothetical protein V3T72_13240, partial [Thermoanaerobaculia bacterium]